MKHLCTVLAALGLGLVPIATYADWLPGDPHKMHNPQLPDLEDTGLDVLAGPRESGGFPPYEKFLADDFRCTQSGPITDIHFWGSYNEDLAFAWPNTMFSLAIYDNIPAGVGGIPYSRPGNVLWSTYMAPTNWRLEADNLSEGFYDPNVDDIVGIDTMVWQFNFILDPVEAFEQQEGEIYWLTLKHTFDLNDSGSVSITDYTLLRDSAPSAFGWKTSLDAFEDNAVWADVSTLNTLPGEVLPEGEVWNELNYPVQHPLAGESMHLAFVITPEPSTLVLLGIAALGIGWYRRRK